MSEPLHLGLDNPALNGRLRVPSGNPFDRYQPRPSKRYFDEQIRKSPPRSVAPAAPAPVWAQPLSGTEYAQPSQAEEYGYYDGYDEEAAAITPEQVPVQPMAAPEATASAAPAQDPMSTLAGVPPSAWVEPEPLGFARSTPRSKPFANFKAWSATLRVNLGNKADAAIRQLRPAAAQLNPRNLRGLPGAVKQGIKEGRYSRLQMALTGMAVVVFVVGLMVSFQSAQTNHQNAAKVAALSKSEDQAGGTAGGSVPSTTKPSASAVSNYVVAPDLPRYIRIPKLGVNARVMQTGVKSDGSLGTPGNVYDTAWYTGSAKPGQPGAMLIDGHVSSWTTHGVFYGLKRLVAGDIITVQRGDGQVFTYKVVKTQVYPDTGVDMQAAVTPITPGKPGLNLITCTGSVKPGTSEFNQRIIVFAEQI